MNRHRHLVIIIPALILLASTALSPDHCFYPASNSTHAIRTAQAVFLDNFLSIFDDPEPVMDTYICLDSDHFDSAFVFRNYDNTPDNILLSGYLSII